MRNISWISSPSWDCPQAFPTTLKWHTPSSSTRKALHASRPLCLHRAPQRLAEDCCVLTWALAGSVAKSLQIEASTLANTAAPDWVQLTNGGGGNVYLQTKILGLERHWWFANFHVKLSCLRTFGNLSFLLTLTHGVSLKIIMPPATANCIGSCLQCVNNHIQSWVSNPESFASILAETDSLARAIDGNQKWATGTLKVVLVILPVVDVFVLAILIRKTLDSAGVLQVGPEGRSGNAGLVPTIITFGILYQDIVPTSHRSKSWDQGTHLPRYPPQVLIMSSRSLAVLNSASLMPFSVHATSASDRVRMPSEVNNWCGKDKHSEPTNTAQTLTPCRLSSLPCS